MEKGVDADLILQIVSSIEKTNKSLEDAFNSRDFDKFSGNKKTILKLLNDLNKNLQ